jgi:hypothetical protein
MPAILHILTKPEDAFAREIISHQKQSANVRVESVDLTRPEPDYGALLEKIFAADSVEVW